MDKYIYQLTFSSLSQDVLSFLQILLLHRIATLGLLPSCNTHILFKILNITSRYTFGRSKTFKKACILRHLSIAQSGGCFSSRQAQPYAFDLLSKTEQFGDGKDFSFKPLSEESIYLTKTLVTGRTTLAVVFTS